MAVTYRFYIKLSCIACLDVTQNGLRAVLEDATLTMTNVQGLRYCVDIKVDNDETDNEETRKNLRQSFSDFGLDYLEIKPEQMDSKQENPSKKWWQSHWVNGVVGVGLGFIILVLSLVGGGLPLWAMLSLSLASLFLGRHSLRNAFVQLRRQHVLSMDFLFVLSALTALIVSILSVFVPWLPMMFETPLLIFGFSHLGTAIKESLTETLFHNVSFKSRLPQYVTLHENKQTIALEAVQIDDVLSIQPGQIIPLDGICLEEAYLFDTIHQGSLEPRKVAINEKLSSGMILTKDSPAITLRVTADSDHSLLARLDKQLQQDLDSKAPIEAIAAKLLHYFIPTVLAVSVITGITLGIFFSPALAITCALSVLVSACPCIFGMIIPMTVKIAMHKSAELLAYFKEASHLQAAASIDTVVFDLHGTLTKGKPQVINFVSLNPKREQNLLLAYASLMEADSEHAVGQAIYRYLADNYEKPASTEIIIDKTNHSGVKAQIDQQQLLLGNEDLLQAEGISCDAVKSMARLQPSESLSYLVQNGEIIGYFVLADQLRDDAKACIEYLIEHDYEVYLFTGATKDTALKFARQAGIFAGNVRAGCVSFAQEETTQMAKNALIQHLKQNGRKVLMVGDGGNDAPALTISDLGVVMCTESSDEMTQKQAGLMIRGERLSPLISALSIAKQSIKSIYQNIIFSLGYNTFAMLFTSILVVGFGIVLNPGVGAAFMIFQMVFVFGYISRLKLQAAAQLEANDNVSKAYNYFAYEPGKHPSLGEQNTLSANDTYSDIFHISNNTSFVDRDTDLSDSEFIFQ